jgi:hypothetical protein
MKIYMKISYINNGSKESAVLDEELEAGIKHKSYAIKERSKEIEKREIKLLNINLYNEMNHATRRKS